MVDHEFEFRDWGKVGWVALPGDEDFIHRKVGISMIHYDSYH